MIQTFEGMIDRKGKVRLLGAVKAINVLSAALIVAVGFFRGELIDPVGLDISAAIP